MLPPQIRQHPIETLIAAGLLLALLVGASQQPNSQSNPPVSACAGHGCMAAKPPA
ncbi:MAG: hypothetical protein WDN03_05460 [Rhizomicrobium sp.]